MSAADPSKPFTDLGIEELEGLGFPPEFVYATGVGEREPGVFQIPYGRRNQEPHLRLWAGGDEGEAWPDLSPGVWWPTGRDGRNVIVCLGATDALFLCQQLFSVDSDGRFHRRPGVSRLLGDAAVVALPRDVVDLSLCWYVDPERNIPALLREIVVEHRDQIFLAVPVPPRALQSAQGEPCLEQFAGHFRNLAENYGPRASVVPLPWLGSFKELLGNDDHRGAKAQAALGGIFALADAFYLRAEEWRRLSEQKDPAR